MYENEFAEIIDMVNVAGAAEWDDQEMIALLCRFVKAQGASPALFYKFLVRQLVKRKREAV